MKIIKGKISDLKNIMQIYNSCIRGMIKNNIDQWDNSYPNAKIISNDLEAKTYYYVCVPHLPEMKAKIIVE